MSTSAALSNLSLAANISGVAGFADLIEKSARIYQYLQDAAQIDDDLVKLKQQLFQFRVVWESVQYRIATRPNDPSLVEFTKIVSSPFREHVTDVFDQLDAAIIPSMAQRSSKDKLLWPYEREKLESLLSILDRWSNLTQFSLHLDNEKLLNELHATVADTLMPVARKTEIQVNIIKTRGDDQEFANIIAWLSPLDFRARQRTIIKERGKGTGEWFLGMKEVDDWMSGPPSLLWCQGGPGVGKSMLASILADHLGKKADSGFPVLTVFFNFKESSTYTQESIIGSLLRQLFQFSVGGNAPLLSIKKLYDSHASMCTKPTLDELHSTLKEAITGFPKVYIILDAMDECPDLAAELLETIRSYPDASSVMATSRNSPWEHLEPDKHISISSDDTDIQAYLQQRIAADIKWLTRKLIQQPGLKDDIVSKVAEKASGMFLLARLHMDALGRKNNLRELRNALGTLPQKLEETYDDALRRIKNQDDESRKLGMRILMWLTTALRLLTLPELQQALAVEPEDTEFNEDGITDEGVMLSACAGLVTIDEKSRTLRLVHYTAQKYFETKSSSLFPGAHKVLADTCLTYLSFDGFPNTDLN